MASAPRKRERRDRLAALLGDPDTLRALCDHVIEGGTLVEWCRARDVKYTDVAAWIAAEDHRREKFEAAKDLRGEFLAELVVRNLRMFADVDMNDALDKRGKLLPFRQIPEHIRRAIREIEYSLAGKPDKIKLVAPERAIELLGKYRKMFTDRIEHDASETLEELLTRSRAESAA